MFHRSCLVDFPFRVRATLVALCLLPALPASHAMAEPGGGTLTVTTNMTIADGDLAFEGFDVIVQGATLTINGAHAFSSLTVERNGGNQAGSSLTPRTSAIAPSPACG